MSFGDLLLSAGLLVPSRQEAADATEACKGVSEGHLFSLPGIAEIYGCPYWISIGPLFHQPSLDVARLAAEIHATNHRSMLRVSRLKFTPMRNTRRVSEANGRA